MNKLHCFIYNNSNLFTNDIQYLSRCHIRNSGLHGKCLLLTANSRGTP